MILKTRKYFHQLFFALGIFVVCVTIVKGNEPLTDQLLSRNNSDRQAAVAELRNLDAVSKRRLIPELVPSLANNDALVATWASEALVMIGADAAPAVFDFLKTNRNEANYARTTLVHMVWSAVPTLTSALQDS